jgi:hypothetical protein
MIPGRHRRRRRSRGPLWIGLIAAAIVSAASGRLLYDRLGRDFGGARERSERPSSFVEPAVSTHISRPVYPLSVIPGGAYNSAELIAAQAADGVVAEHFWVFQRASLRTVTSPFTRPVYVSYRRGESIYWTTHPIRLLEGEALLTDGKLYARTRCGNRISETPQEPTSEAEPPPETLDTPEESLEADVPSPLKPTDIPAPGEQRRLVGGALSTGAHVSGVVFGGSGGPGGQVNTPPIAVIPEPGSFVLLLTGLVAIAGIRLRRKGKPDRRA